jgi:type IV pilus assembly protein PilM
LGIKDILGIGNRFVSYDIGSSAIKIVELESRVGTKIELSKFDIFNIPRDMINVNFNDSLIVDKNSFKELLADHTVKNKIKNQKCGIMLSDGNAIINWLNVKLNAGENLGASISEKLGALFPSDIANWEYHWQTLEEKKDNFTIISEAILRENVMEVGEVFHEISMWPHFLDVSCFNSINMFHNFLVSSENNKKNISLIYLGNDSTTVMIFNNGMLKSFRLIPFGGKDFTAAICDSLGMTFEDAENFKQNERFFLREYSDEQNKLENYNVVKNVFGEIVKGIYNSFDSYLAKFREFKIHKIILYGGTANFRNINVLLQKHLNIPVTLGSELVTVKHKGHELSSDDKNILIPVIGGLIRD